MKEITHLYNKLPKNPLIRVVAVSAAIGLALYTLPFVLAGLIIWFVFSNVTAPKLRNPIIAVVAIAGFLFGVPWTMAFVDPSSYQPKTVNQVASPEPTESTASTTPTETSETPEPTVEKKTIIETQVIPFEKKTIDDANLDKGKSAVTTKGVDGTKTLTYEVTITNGTQTDKKLIKEEITAASVTEVTSVGTKVAIITPSSTPTKTSTPTATVSSPAQSQCDPNYSGACVPIASDVDCAGGSGNGPAYVRGPVYVVGTDIYDLDRDGDGVACER